jgi:hypothetical protein
MGLKRKERRDDADQRAPRRMSLRGRRGATVDLTDDASSQPAERTWPDEPIDPAMAERLAESRRRREARREAEAELLRLRQRHWSGERIIEESRTPMEWWEHPEADPYAVLGLFPGATLEQASQARRKIASENHPDLVPASHAIAVVRTRRMVAANSAYDRLKRALLPNQEDLVEPERPARSVGFRPAARNAADR